MFFFNLLSFSSVFYLLPSFFPFPCYLAYSIFTRKFDIVSHFLLSFPLDYPSMGIAILYVTSPRPTNRPLLTVPYKTFMWLFSLVLTCFYLSHHIWQVSLDPKKFMGVASAVDAVEYLHSGKSVGKVLQSLYDRLSLFSSTPMQLTYFSCGIFSGRCLHWPNVQSDTR
jgi:hypothetical protein